MSVTRRFKLTELLVFVPKTRGEEIELDFQHKTHYRWFMKLKSLATCSVRVGQFHWLQNIAAGAGGRQVGI